MFQDVGASEDLNEQFRNHLSSSDHPLDSKFSSASQVLLQGFDLLYRLLIGSISRCHHPGTECLYPFTIQILLCA